MTAPAEDADADVLSHLHAVALTYARHGVHIFPCVPAIEGDRSSGKRPLGRLAPSGVHSSTNDVDQVDRWWREAPDANIGIDLGRSGVWLIDVDGPDAAQVLSDMQSVFGDLPDTYTITTGRPEGGRHIMFRQPDGPAVGNGKIDADVGLEFKGEGGYAIAPPSHHWSGSQYQANGKWADIAEPPQWLLDIVRPTPAPTLPTPDRHVDVQTSGDDRAAQASFAAAVQKVANGQPGNRNHILFWASCVAGSLIAANRLGPEAVSALEQAAEASGLTAEDGARAVAATIASGINKGAETPEWTPAVEPVQVGGVVLNMPTQAPETPQQAPTADQDDWTPAQLQQHLDGSFVQPPTVWGRRTDGHHLFYPSETHAIYGPPESAKTWLALTTVVEAITEGRDGLVIDFENSAATIVRMLRTLGAPDPAIGRHVLYIRPTGPLTQQASDQLHQLLEQRDVAVCVIDGVTNGMSMHGLEPLDNTDAAAWDRLLPSPAARAGACVVSVDHTAKSAAEGNRYAIGAQHKLAVITGAAYVVKPDPRNPFGPGLRGRSFLTVAKDRPGTVREFCGGNDAGTFTLDSTGDLSSVYIDPPPDKAAADARNLQMMVRDVVDWIAAKPPRHNLPGHVWSDVRKAVVGDATALAEARDTAAARGLIRTVPHRDYKDGLWVAAATIEGGLTRLNT